MLGKSRAKASDRQRQQRKPRGGGRGRARYNPGESQSGGGGVMQLIASSNHPVFSTDWQTYVRLSRGSTRPGCICSRCCKDGEDAECLHVWNGKTSGGVSDGAIRPLMAANIDHKQQQTRAIC